MGEIKYKVGDWELFVWKGQYSIFHQHHDLLDSRHNRTSVGTVYGTHILDFTHSFLVSGDVCSKCNEPVPPLIKFAAAIEGAKE